MIRMKQLFFIFFITSAFCSQPGYSQRNLHISSPSGNIVVHFKRTASSLLYSVSFNGKKLVDWSGLSLQFEDGFWPSNLHIGKTTINDRKEEYDLVTGKARHITAHFRELILPVEEAGQARKKINIVARVYDDGFAFRYEFPRQENWDHYVLMEESSRFRISGNPSVHALLLPNFTTSHEGAYTHVAFENLKTDTLLDMPALFEFDKQHFLAITEAALLDYAGMYLEKQGNELVSKLSPLPGQQAVKVRAALPHESPWRVLMISDRIGGLLESNLLTNLNAPNRLGDVSWLKPGKTTFPWWNGNVTPDTLNAPGNNFVTQQYYIDFCARNNIEYHSVVEYGLHQWYVDDGVNFQPGPHADVTKPVPGLDMKEVCDYARSKGVGVRVWVHWAALYPRIDEAFAKFEEWGLSGMMIDFMDRDDQEMVRIQTEMLEKAAKHKLHIQFHGAYKPTGLHRTYPNEFTREGTLNYEVNKWDKKVTPDHDLDIVFVRMLAGSTDYHMGGFRAVPDSLFRVQYTRPLMMGTRCHMLGLYVVFENYLEMVCDYPAAYEGQPGFEFIKEVPTVWDETIVLEAKIREYIIIARRKGDDWYVGGITNHAARKVDVPLQFLKGQRYSAAIYTDDGGVGADPNFIDKKQVEIRSIEELPISMAGGGGFAIHFKRR
jgi:alpha-glucosidase